MLYRYPHVEFPFGENQCSCKMDVQGQDFLKVQSDAPRTRFGEFERR